MKKSIFMLATLVSLTYAKPLVFVKDSIENFIQVASSISHCDIVNDYQLGWEISANLTSPTKQQLLSIINFSLESHGFYLQKLGECSYKVELKKMGFITKRVRVENVDDWIDTITQNAYIIKKNTGRDVFIAKTKNSITITGEKGDVEKLLALVDDRSNQKQVIIQVKIYEMYSSKIKNVGIGFNLIRSFQSPDVVLSSLLSISSNIINEGTIGQYYKNIGDGAVFGGVLNFLEGKDALKVVNSAILEVKSNETASIKDGKELSLVDKVDRYSQKSFTKTTIGLNLMLSPVVLEDDNVFINVKLKDSSIIRYDENNNPILKIKELSTSVKTKSGKEITLGSTYKSLLTLNDNGLYGFSKIPLLGNLFKQQKNDHQDSTLLITMKPYVIKSDEDDVRKRIYKEIGIEDKIANELKKKLKENKNKEPNQARDDRLDWFFE